MVNAVSSVVSAPSGGWSIAAARVQAASATPVQSVSVKPSQPENSSKTADQSKNSTPTQSAQPVAQKGLPLGILESANQPAASNFQANLDYDDLKTALQSGNLAAAQQAYMRMQSDVELPHLTDSITPATAEKTVAHLNVAG